MYVQKKSIKLQCSNVAMMVKDYELMMGLQHILLDTSTGKIYKKEILRKVNITD